MGNDDIKFQKTLEIIATRLTGIESQLVEVVRLEERLNNHDNTLSRYGNRLDEHSSRIRQSELWQANYGDRSSVEKMVDSVKSDIHKISDRVGNLESSADISNGKKDVGKEVLKWISGILGAILIYKINKGE